MLSYRHSYHAGNHADVLKHAILIQLLEHLRQKEKPFWVIDTHAGAGIYALDSEHAEKLGEYREGIGRLWQRTDLPPALAAYVQHVRDCNDDGSLSAYPGSPWLAKAALREQDRLRLFELHSTDHRLLDNNLGHGGKQVMVYADDGFARLKALLPPPSRRGLVFIDPSYELREDYGRLIEVLEDARQRFATGIYAVWYPMLARPESRQFATRLKAAAGDSSWVHASLSVRAIQQEGPGMYGSGMFILNPPWTLADTLARELPWLRDALAETPEASFTLEQQTR